MKKNIIIISTIIILVILGIIGFNIYNYYKIKNAKINIELIDNLNIEFNTKVYLSDIIKKVNGTYIDQEIPTTKLGENTIKFNYINDDKIKVSKDIKYNVIDTIPPFINLPSKYSVIVGSEDNLLKNIMCADNIDDNPSCSIEGEYNLEEVGSYPLTFKAVDKSGNETIKEFELIVKEKTKQIYSNNYTDFKTIYNKYKTDDTKIGLDLSKYQGDVDFKAIKDEGVSFVIIRVGTIDAKRNYVKDPKFDEYIKGALKEDIDVGIYFYSYAMDEDEAIRDAKWVIKQIKDYNITMPVAFDWEDFSDYNSYKLSFYKLNKIANAYLNELKSANYTPILYGSKFYLENVWMNEEFDTWLAHYTDETNYTKDYIMWQLCDNGKINGIKNYVDIDIYYEKGVNK
mgnify:FL=1